MPLEVLVDLSACGMFELSIARLSSDAAFMESELVTPFSVTSVTVNETKNARTRPKLSALSSASVA